jgi:hypothetical protein
MERRKLEMDGGFADTIQNKGKIASTKERE